MCGRISIFLTLLLLHGALSVAAVDKKSFNWDEEREFWSFRRPTRHTVEVRDPQQWIKGPIDSFILAKLQKEGVAPSKEADRFTLGIRSAIDITGLPPSSGEMEMFLYKDDEAAYTAWIDQLIASPAFGENWAKLWLDVVRYAEDQAHIVGNNNELFYPNAYLYRDWVIDAFNDDLPYDEFIRRQFAADRLFPDNPDEHAALGFIGLGPKYYARRSAQVMADEWEDRVDTVTRGLLGLTVACARCHDHMYDPIPTEDYYALAGVFAGTEMFNRPLTDSTKTRKDGQADKPEDAIHIIREKEPVNLKVHLRGDAKNLGDEVHRGFLTIFGKEKRREFNEGSGRLELARSIANRENPLTARVFVNRVWSRMFGTALVSTPSNFGRLGAKPSHPELLDDLAVRFMEKGWSVKWLVRELALSATYRQSSRIRDSANVQDPDNKLYWRMNRKRLNIEAWRDRLLASVGELQPTVGGKSFKPSDPESQRRTLYARVSRLKLDPMLARFDHPDPNLHSPKRNETTTPLQKLFSINHPLMLRMAEALNEKLADPQQVATDERIREAYRILFLRSPSQQELQLGLRFFNASQDPQKEAWVQYLQALLASNELLYLD